MSTYQRVPFFQFDSFSPTPLGGNPAAVLLLPAHLPPIDGVASVNIAAENALSETAFLTPLGSDTKNGFDQADTFNLRWFTPTKEVALCGHGTLAAAAAIFRSGNPHSQLIFRTLSGELVALRDSAAVGDPMPLITLDFPMNVPIIVSASAGQGDNNESAIIREVADFFMQETEAVTSTRKSLEIFRLAHCPRTKKLIIHCAPPASEGGSTVGWSEALSVLQSLKVPSVERVLQAHDGSIVTGVSVVVAGPGPEECLEHAPHFFSRYFSPWNGIPEDPVNGSSHTILAPYWAIHVLNAQSKQVASSRLSQEAAEQTGELEGELKQDDRGFVGVSTRMLKARQASPRGGDLVIGADFSRRRVTIAGHAALVIDGHMAISTKVH